MIGRQGVRRVERYLHRVQRVLADPVDRLRIPVPDDLVETGFRRPERLLQAAPVLADALLLRAGEERPGHQRANHDQGEDGQRQRHSAFVLQHPFHTSRSCKSRRH